MPTHVPGATYLGGNWARFNVWAPLAERVVLKIIGPDARLVNLDKDERGYHHALVEDVSPATRYQYALEGETLRPDPASRFQPEGVHGPSQVVDHATFEWCDSGWCGLPLRDYIIYELHVGTFTPEGTFDGVVSQLDYLKELGITAVEIMPVAQFPGSRNWGYDGVYPFAVQDSYGGVDGLKRLVNACHQKGLAVILDVVYNHLGPEGNYMRDFGPYFTDWYSTPWGAAINFDGPDSDEVKRFFIENALYWITEFRIDALRLDAVHAILDHSARHFLERLAEAVKDRSESLNRRAYLIAESSDNDRRLITSRDSSGLGMDAQWSDDFHHCVHTLLTGESDGYYRDYEGVRHLAKAIQEGFVYSGEYSPYRRRTHGSSGRNIPAERFVICSQNHDQIGNRMLAERMTQLASFEQLKLAAGATLLSPNVPMLFMGEEYGETARFQYFISHTDSDLVEAVREGRRKEFESFGWEVDPPDPQDEATFTACKLDHSLRKGGNHKALIDFYKELIRLRKTNSALARLDKDSLETQAYENAKILFVRRWSDNEDVVILHNFDESSRTITLPFPEGHWRKQLDSAGEEWGGTGSPIPEFVSSDGEESLTLAGHSVVLLVKESEE